MHCLTTQVRAISDKVSLRGGIDIRSDIFLIHYSDLLKIPSVLSIDTWGEKTVPWEGGGGLIKLRDMKCRKTDMQCSKTAD